MEGLDILLKKSLYIIIYYITVAVFSCLAFSSLVVSFEKTNQLQDGLGIESLQVNIQEQEIDESSNSNFKTADLIESLKEISISPFIMYKDTGTPHGKEFYVHNSKLPLVKENAENIPNTVYLDKSFEKNSIEKKNNHYFIYKSIPYKVVGIYEQQRKNINQNSVFLAAMDITANGLGMYYIDGIHPSDMNKVVEHLENREIFVDATIIPMKKTMKERITLVAKDQAVVLILLIVTLILIGMNTIGVTINWILSRNDEIYVRYLVGGTTRKINWWLLKEYWLILIFSFVIGFILAMMLLKIGIFKYVVSEIDRYGIGLAFVFCLIIGTLTKIISLLLVYRGKNKFRKGY